MFDENNFPIKLSNIFQNGSLGNLTKIFYKLFVIFQILRIRNARNIRIIYNFPGDFRDLKK